MSTRGAYGFRLNGQDYITYNHSDSYPEGLGEDILKDLRFLILEGGIDGLKKGVADIKIINKSKNPDDKAIEALKLYTDLTVGKKTTSDWYCLTRGLQGGIKELLKVGYMGDNQGFLLDSVFCEWAYIVNLDDGLFEIYKGFNSKPGDGRYGNLKAEKNSEYFGVSLKWTIPLNFLPESLGVLKITDIED